MKTNNVNLVVVLAIGIILVTNTYSRDLQECPQDNQIDSTSAPSATFDSTQIVSSHFFFSVGWGRPEGNRFEFGQYVGSNIMVGATFVINDKWSNDRSAGKTGVMLGLRFPWSDMDVSPFVLASVGESWGIFTTSEYYFFIHLGVKAKSKSLIQFRPEVGLDVTSKNDGSSSTKKEIWLAFNLSIELQLP